MPDVAGFFAPWGVYALITVLHLVLPGRWYQGYVTQESTGELLRYRLNGWWVLAVTVALWVAAGVYDVVPWGWWFEHRWAGLAGACTLGLLYTAAMVLPAPPTGRAWIVDWLLGRAVNPQRWGGRFDHKMWLYLVGAVMLELNVLSFTAYRLQMNPTDPSPGILLCAGMPTWFVCDYLTFERVRVLPAWCPDAPACGGRSAA